MTFLELKQAVRLIRPHRDFRSELIHCLDLSFRLSIEDYNEDTTDDQAKYLVEQAEYPDEYVII